MVTNMSYVCVTAGTTLEVWRLRVVDYEFFFSDNGAHSTAFMDEWGAERGFYFIPHSTMVMFRIGGTSRTERDDIASALLGRSMYGSHGIIGANAMRALNRAEVEALKGYAGIVIDDGRVFRPMRRFALRSGLLR